MTFLRNLFRRTPKPQPELGRTARELLSLLDADDWETDGGRELTYHGPFAPDVELNLYGIEVDGPAVLVNGTNLFEPHEHTALFSAALATRDRVWRAREAAVRKTISAQAARMLAA